MNLKTLSLLTVVMVGVAVANPTKKIQYSQPYYFFSLKIIDAYKRDKTIGQITYDQNEFAHKAFIVNLVVDKKYRKQGTGRVLMNHALSDCDAHTYKEIVLTAIPASDSDMSLKDLIKFYQKFGFNPIEPVKETSVSCSMSKINTSL